MAQSSENGLTLEGVADDLETVKSIMFTLARQYERIDRTLDRTATQQEINTQAIAQINQGMTQTNQGMTRMTQAIAQLAETSTQQWQVTQQILAEIREMQAEVRGLQVENRRILQRVFGTEEE